MDRLTKEQWLDHGLQTLATDGFTALKADKLVKTLGVSRGSFYWHFKNLADFHAEVIRRWQAVSVVQVIADLDSSEQGPVEKLSQLIRTALNEGLELGQAIRAWAFNNATVQEAVDCVDTQCMDYLKLLLQDMGQPETTASVRARLIYCGYLGQVMLGGKLDEENQRILVEELIELASRPIERL